MSSITIPIPERTLFMRWSPKQWATAAGWYRDNVKTLPEPTFEGALIVHETWELNHPNPPPVPKLVMVGHSDHIRLWVRDLDKHLRKTLK